MFTTQKLLSCTQKYPLKFTQCDFSKNENILIKNDSWEGSTSRQVYQKLKTNSSCPKTIESLKTVLNDMFTNQT